MKSIGRILILLGLFSIIFHFFGREARLLMWINTWGETVAWVIRISLLVAGIILVTRPVPANDPPGGPVA